eukprot:1031416-Pleurochrysis_carterae.AAC.1
MHTWGRSSLEARQLRNASMYTSAKWSLTNSCRCARSSWEKTPRAVRLAPRWTSSQSRARASSCLRARCAFESRSANGSIDQRMLATRSSLCA